MRIQANPSANPLANPLGHPSAGPLAHPLANPVANPLADPSANPLADHSANPLTNPLANPSKRVTMGSRRYPGNLVPSYTIKMVTIRGLIRPCPSVRVFVRPTFCHSKSLTKSLGKSLSDGYYLWHNSIVFVRLSVRLSNFLSLKISYQIPWQIPWQIHL